MKNKKPKENPFCDFSFFMKHGCRGCKRQRECEEYEAWIKRDSTNNINNNSVCVSNNKFKKRLSGKVKQRTKAKIE